jgi:hypothetical protein
MKKNFEQNLKSNSINSSNFPDTEKSHNPHDPEMVAYL